MRYINFQLQCELCQKLVNSLIRSKCLRCYELTGRPTTAAKKRARNKIKLYYCLDGTRSFNENSEPKFRH